MTADRGDAREVTAPFDQNDPRAIAEQLLAESGAALMTRDFPRFRVLFELPHRVETYARHSVIRTEDDMRRVFDGVCGHLRETGIEKMVRVVLDARFRGDGRMEYTHETHLLQSGFWAEAPCTAYSVVLRRGDAWRVAESCYAVASGTIHGRALHANARSIAFPPPATGATAP
jgi:hypothetical protein